MVCIVTASTSSMLSISSSHHVTLSRESEYAMAMVTVSPLTEKQPRCKSMSFLTYKELTSLRKNSLRSSVCPRFTFIMFSCIATGAPMP